MATKSNSSMKELRESATAAINGGIKTKEALKSAIPVLVELQESARVAYRTARKSIDIAGDLADACAEYALSHPSCFDDGLRTEDGVQVGNITIDDVTYHLASGYGAPKRVDGDNISQDYLSTLPKEWVKARLAIDTTGINRAGITVENLEEYGLYRPADNKWSVREQY